MACPIPALYCGRTVLEDGKLGDCGACPRGFQPNSSAICVSCHDQPTFYDWLYICFMAMLSLILHWFFIDYTNHRKSVHLFIFHASAFVESCLSLIAAILVFDPKGTFQLRSCKVNDVSDWYTMLYNPQPDYTTTLHCTQEAVYPLYTIVMVYYAISLVVMMLIRPILAVKLLPGRGAKAIYAALYFFPILVVVHAVLAGLIYYAFPYIVMAVSLITLALHLAQFDNQSMLPLLKSCFQNTRNIAILLGHWALHAFSIVAMTNLQKPEVHAPLLLLVPVPTIFYILTVKFTDPDKLNAVEKFGVPITRTLNPLRDWNS